MQLPSASSATWAAAANPTFTLTSGTTSGLFVGQLIFGGTGIPPGATISSVTNSTQFVLAGTTTILGTAAAITAANPGVDPKKLQINQEINIPAPTPKVVTPPALVDPSGPTSYKVVSGDTLGGIAKKFGTTTKAIQSLNGLTTTSIKAGQTLKIPAKTAPAPAPEPPPVAPIAPTPMPSSTAPTTR